MNRLALLLLLAAFPAAAQDQGRVVRAPGAVLPHRARPDVVNRILKDRLENLLPALMRESGIDLWLVVNREYAEDPVYLTLIPEPELAARRLSILLFHDRGDRVERLTVSRYGMPGFYESAWDGKGGIDGQWQRLGQLLRERNPKKVGINVSGDWAFGDGLTHGLYERLAATVDAGTRAKFTSAERLAVRWLESRTAMELEVYPHVVALARSVVAEAFSEKVITPGVTTTDDVAWYIRQRYADLGLDVWFPPYVDIQRAGEACTKEQPFCGTEGVIRRGDVLHTDVGITYLRLNTDTQEMGYVLRLGETDVPESLRRALATGNRWQDLVTSQFATGRSGNEVFARARAAMEKEGISGATYSHPIGFFGHAPGAAIGMWDNQGPVPVTGEWTLRPNTAWAIEGYVSVPVPEWNGQYVQMKLEQSASFDGERVLYLAGRQTEWHVVR